jgi:hypothetical protein
LLKLAQGLPRVNRHGANFSYLNIDFSSCSVGYLFISNHGCVLSSFWLQLPKIAQQKAAKTDTIARINLCGFAAFMA